MFLRQKPTETLTTVLDKVDATETAETAVCLNTQVELALTEGDTPTVRFGDQTTFEVPATPDTINALGKWLTVPAKFLGRLNADLQQHLLMGLLRQTPGNMLIRWNDSGIVEVRDPGTRVIDPRWLIEAAARTITPEAPVVDFWSVPDDFRLDTIVPEGSDFGWGGDRPTGKRAVGDITGGGIRIGQDRKHNLAPWVSPYLYRLACTNGYEMLDPGLKVDARGQTIEQVMSEFEAACQRAFGRVESDIRSFYDMRNQKVDNPERTVLRIAREQGLPERTALALVERVPAIVEGDASMFDVVNMVTNLANDPSIAHRSGVRRNLEITGGEIISEHVERCGHCHSRLAAS